FRAPHHLALLVRPFATKASTAGIFIWENGKVNGEASYLEFPFHSANLGDGRAPELSDPKAATPPLAARPAPKAAVRAQIVPIASRREISLLPVPAAEPAPPAPPVTAAPPPTPAGIVKPPAPAVEEKTPAAADKPAKIEKPGKNEKTVKAEKAARIESSESKIAPRLDTYQAEALPAVVTPEILAPAGRAGKGMKLLLAAAASIALFVTLFVYPGLLRSNSKPLAPPLQDSSQLQLRVERARGELLLTWNRDSDAIRNAGKAVLDITDGAQHENVQMDLAQLAIGSIMYSPSGNDISFKMEVIDKSQKATTSESVRMLRPPSPLQEQHDAAAEKAAGLPPGTKPAAAPSPAGTPDPSEQPVAEQPAKQASAPLKQFQAASLSQRLRPAAPTDMADAPTLGAGDRPTTSAIPGVNMNALVPPCPLPPPPRPPPAAHPRRKHESAGPALPAPPAATPAASSPAEAKPKSGGNIRPAVLIYRKDAEYPKIARQTGAKGTVTLNATIGTDGIVKKVKIVSGHPMLTAAAADAVKQWRYRPTLLNGQPVECDTVVLINFVADR